MSPTERATEAPSSTSQDNGPTMTAVGATNIATASVVFAMLKELIQSKTLDADKMLTTIEYLTSEVRKDPAADKAIAGYIEAIRSMRPDTGGSNG